MKYIKPTYNNEKIETSDIILASEIMGTTVENGKDENSGVVSTDMSYILGFR